jgi:hypothetical protein
MRSEATSHSSSVPTIRILTGYLQTVNVGRLPRSRLLAGMILGSSHHVTWVRCRRLMFAARDGWPPGAMCYAVDTTDRGPRCGHAERRRPRDAVVLVLALFLIVVALRLR